MGTDKEESMWVITLHENTGEAVAYRVPTVAQVGEYLADWAEEREAGTVMAITLRWEPEAP